MYNIPVLEKYELHKEVVGLNVWSMKMKPPNASTPINHVEHGYTVLQYLLMALSEFLTREQILEHVQVLYMVRTLFALKYAKRSNARVLNLSSEFMDYDYFHPEKGHLFEEELAKQCLMFAGAGNDGNEPLEHYEALAASRDAFIAIGAIDDELNPRSYSSWGSGDIMFSAVDGYFGKYGTSYASPYITGLVAGYEVKHFIEYGFYPSFDQTCKWMMNHAVDIADIGYDLKTGYGTIIPREPNYFVTKYDVKTKQKTIIGVGETDKLIHKDICDVKYITSHYDKENGVAYYSHAI